LGGPLLANQPDYRRMCAGIFGRKTIRTKVLDLVPRTGLSMLPCILLWRRQQLSRAASEGEIRWRNSLWCVLLTVIAWVWLSGYLALRDQPKPDQVQAFHLATQIFVYFTILGQVFTTIYLSPSRAAMFSVLFLGVFLPIQFIEPQLIAVQKRNGA
jgi:hypothetical protein